MKECIFNSICFGLGILIATVIVTFSVGFVKCTKNAFSRKDRSFFSHYKQLLVFTKVVLEETMPFMIGVFITFFVLYFTYTMHIEFYKLIVGE